MTTEVHVKSHQAQLTATWRTKTTHTAVFEHIPVGFGRVMSHLGEVGIHPVGAPFTIFHQAPDGDSEGDIAMAVPISDSFAAESMPEDSGIELVKVAAGPTASIMHTGSYANMGESYATVVSWIHNHGHTIVGPAREVYLNSPVEADEAELRTEIHFPIEDGDAS